MEYILLKKNDLSFFLQKNTKLPFAITIIDQKKHKIQQIYIDTLLIM